MNRKVELKVTGDGSHTLYVPELNENYHSYHGAYAEAVHVFIKMGMETVKEMFTPIRVLEVGFGTGLNATLAFEFAAKHKYPVEYTGVEKFPLSTEVIIQLNYSEFWNSIELDNAYTKMHEAGWNAETTFPDFFQFKKIEGEIQNVPFNANHFHVVFFDAFAPEKQPDMWTVDVFKKLYDVLAPGGILVTYCAQGQFKRNLKAAGFNVVSLPGPPGKREMVKGVKG